MKAAIQSFHFLPQTSLPFPPSKRVISVKCSNPPATNDDGIPTDLVKTLAKIKSRHNSIRVLEVSRTADHPFRGSRLLLLDSPGNIHSINFLHKTLTETYFDVFATLPPILPPGPVGVLGFGGGSAAKLILELYPNSIIHGWEIDPAVIEIANDFFGVADLQRDLPDRLFVHIGDALDANLAAGFAGIVVDLFSEGSLVPELQDPATWTAMKGKLRDGGRIMVNVGGSCVESENGEREGKAVMEETLMAMKEVFGEEVRWLRLGNGMDDSSIALTGGLPWDLKGWKEKLPEKIRFYVDMWTPLPSQFE